MSTSIRESFVCANFNSNYPEMAGNAANRIISRKASPAGGTKVFPDVGKCILEFRRGKEKSDILEVFF